MRSIPNRSLDCYVLTNFFLSSVFPFLGYNGTPVPDLALSGNAYGKPAAYAEC